MGTVGNRKIKGEDLRGPVGYLLHVGGDGAILSKKNCGRKTGELVGEGKKCCNGKGERVRG